MSGSAIVMLCFACLVLYGGLAYCVWRAIMSGRR